MLEHLTRQGVTGRLELVLVDRGVTAAAARILGTPPRRGTSLRHTGSLNTVTRGAHHLRTTNRCRPRFRVYEHQGRRVHI